MFINFAGKNLQGHDFSGQNLTGADFSNADIRGANFTNAILKNANFQNAKGGVQVKKVILLLLIMFVLFGVAGGASGLGSVNLTILFSNKYIDKYTMIPGVVSLFAFIIFFAITIKRGFGVDLAIATGILTGVIAAVVWGYLLVKFGSLGTNIASQTGWRVLGAGVWEFAGFTLGTVMLTSARLLSRSSSFIFWMAWVIGALFATTASLFLKPTSVNWYQFWVSNLIVLVFFAIVCGYVSFLTRVNNEKFLFIYRLAVEISAIGGTSFRKAKLMDADFSYATLKSTDFSNANLTHTNFYQTKKLHQARIKDTILINPHVLELLVTHNGENKLYKGCNFQGAYLEGANLYNAKFIEADISFATLAGANLEYANLTKAQALNTNFQKANLTAACVESWNIDSTTQLERVICDYVYLLNNQQERRPSSGKFAPGEFTKLFQVVINTVDLIIRNSLEDLQALSVALAKVRIENEDIPLTPRSIENKGDGVVLVRFDVPEATDKAKIHAEIIQNYEFALQQLDAKYQAELKSKDTEISLYQKHQADLKELIQIIAPTVKKYPEEKLVILKLGQGDLSIGFPVTLQISLEGKSPYFESTGQLPSASELALLSNQWQTVYRQSLEGNLRIKFPETQVTNISKRELFRECDKLADALKKQVNLWLNSELFRPVKEQLLEKLNPSESIRILLQTEDSQLRRIPWQLWDFFERYPQAEIALSSTVYEKKEKSQSSKSHVKILAILGDSTGIDIQKDRFLLEQLPNAEVTFLVEPKRQVLNDELWLQSWDILFFAGHSCTQSETEEIGYFHINQTDTLTIAELKNALTKAISQGLHLAIFNSCDGLGIANNLADLHIPQMIVMREPVPDQVAQEFLKNFLTEFSNGKPLYQSVREARYKLQGLEDKFPCATLLPVICQNPAEIPLAWHSVLK
jgi:uncharacterized protein YjbI with pentapeptide repeats